MPLFPPSRARLRKNLTGEPGAWLRGPENPRNLPSYTAKRRLKDPAAPLLGALGNQLPHDVNLSQHPEPVHFGLTFGA